MKFDCSGLDYDKQLSTIADTKSESPSADSNKPKSDKSNNSSNEDKINLDE